MIMKSVKLYKQQQQSRDFSYLECETLFIICGDESIVHFRMFIEI
jgi:hypothetical protein